MLKRFSRRSYSRRHLYFAARRTKLRFGAALSHWAAPQSNPFLAQELHRSLRRKSGPFFILWPLLFIGAALLLVAQFYEIVAAKLPSFAADPNAENFFLNHALGDNKIHFMAIVAVGLCGYVTLLFSQRAGRVILRLHNAGALNQLLLLPINERRVGLLISAPATASAMLLWLVLMPVWLVALTTNQWSWREFFGVPLLFLFFTIRPPEWTPLYETYTPPRAVDDDSDAEETPEEESAKSDATVKANQKSDEEYDEEDETQFIASVSDPRHRQLFEFDPATTIVLLSLWQVVMFWARFAGFRTPPSLFQYLLPQWRDFLPAEVWRLMPSLLLSWPLIVMQLLTTPLPFFGIALPPLLWMLPRVLLMRYAAFSTFRLSYLGAQSLQFRRWGRYWCEAKRTQAYLFWFFASGFLWPWLISKGAFAALIVGAPINASWARAALWTLLLIITTWLVSARLHSVFDTPFKKASRTRCQKITLLRCRKAWQKVKLIFIGPILMYFMLCWLGGSSGMDAVWSSRFLTTLAVMFAYLLTDFASLILKNVLDKEIDALWVWLRFLWFWGLFWETVFRVGWAHYSGVAFDLPDAPHLLLSPFVSLFTLLNSDVALPLQGALWQLGLGAIVFATACLLLFQSQDAALTQEILTSTPAGAKKPSVFRKFVTKLWRLIWFVPGSILQVIFWPFKVGGIGFYKVLKRAKNGAQPFLERQTQDFWLWIDSFDNPVLRRALCRKRDENLFAGWLSFVAIQCFVLAILLCGALFKAVSVLFYGGNTEANRQAALEMLHWRNWGEVVFMVAIGVGFIPNIVALFSHTQIFDNERSNGGMVFLFLTPLTEGEIIGGHLGAALMPTLFSQCAIYPFILLACLLAIAVGQFAILPLFLCITLLLHAFLILNAMSSIWSAARASAKGEGGIWLFFFAMLPQGVFLLIMGIIIASAQGLWATLATIVSIVICLLVTYFFWIDALRSLRQERFGDVSTQGAIAN